MSQKVSCGRLILNSDGTVKKKVELLNGGGVRDLTLSHIDIGFDEIHDMLRDLFNIDPNRRSKLYDYQFTEIDTNRYPNFFEYVHQNGLKFRNTLLYLCTASTENESKITWSSPEKTRTSKKTTKKIPQVEADSSTSPALIRINANSPVDHKPTPESLLNNEIAQNLRVFSFTTFSNYSFEKSLNEFINCLRNVINQYNHENIFIQLFEYICILQGLASITLDRLKQQTQPVHKHEKQFYNYALDKIENLSRKIKAFIELNKMKISHIDQHSIIIDSFNQFHQNFNTLRDQWSNNTYDNRQRTHSSTNHVIDPVPLMPVPSVNRPNHPMPLMSLSTTNLVNDSVPSTSFSSSSSRHHRETNSRKQSRALSPSPHRSHQTSTKDDHNNEKYVLFKNMLKCFDHLLGVLHNLRYTSFSHFIQRIVCDIEYCRSHIKLSEHRSLFEAENLILTIEKALADRINDEYRHAVPHGIDRSLESAFQKTLDEIKHLLNSFHHYQSTIDKNKRSRHTHWTPSDASKTVEREYIERKPTINLNQHQTRNNNDDDDDQSSEPSHSSFADDVLMEVAKDAYEQRPHIYKT
ncbi:unnamed protein product [Adineta steineri]|uniref:Uncharacterized protein n=1 Tax=Adineta steineri TaxID=433720 RepID=A0A814WEW4_9BILA|nr:unnamed protein product [Adineta steineri]